MKAKDLKDKLTEQQILILMEDLGADALEGRNLNEILFRTVCHGGNSHKLYYYRDTKNFHCYTNCGSLDILQILQNALGIDLPKAIEYVCMRFGINDIFSTGFGTQETECDNEDWGIISSFKYRNTIEEKLEEIKILEESLLNHFYKLPHRSFLDDGISIATIHKFNVMYDIFNNRIIIPHRNADAELIAIRCRNLEEDLVSTGRKYMPIILNNKLLSAPTGQYFYGMHLNKDNIRKYKKVILVESEKAVMQLDTMYPDTNIGLALSSSNLSKYQIQILKDMGVEEVIIALDKEFDALGSLEEIQYAKRLQKTILNRLKQEGFSVSVVWDSFNLLNKKDSPTDKGKQVFERLLTSRKTYEILGG